jgi:pimeloyl-ACP methyl ester carboxylesterase
MSLALMAVVLLAVCAVMFLARRHPLKALSLGSRRRLAVLGCKRLEVPSPIGPQSVFVGGSGPVIVCLHGAGDQAGTWARVADNLLKGHTLVLPDLAGHGQSAPPKGPITAGDVYLGLEAVLAGQAKSGPVTLVGNSLGAWMAMRHPEWVLRVVAVNGGPLAGPPSTINLLPATRQEARAAMAGLRAPESRAVPDYVLDDMVRQGRKGPLARFAATAASMGDWVLDEAQLSTLRVPVWLLWGAADQLLPLAYAHRMLACLPEARLIPLERCGHVPQQEAPRRFLAALDRALTEPAS